MYTTYAIRFIAELLVSVQILIQVTEKKPKQTTIKKIHPEGVSALALRSKQVQGTMPNPISDNLPIANCVFI